MTVGTLPTRGEKGDSGPRRPGEKGRQRQQLLQQQQEGRTTMHRSLLSSPASKRPTPPMMARRCQHLLGHSLALPSLPKKADSNTGRRRCPSLAVRSSGSKRCAEHELLKGRRRFFLFVSFFLPFARSRHRREKKNMETNRSHSAIKPKRKGKGSLFPSSHFSLFLLSCFFIAIATVAE